MSRPVPSLYLDRLVHTKSGRRLVAAAVFPNAKEVTESFGVRQALTRTTAFSPADSDVVLVSVGDGTTPRTAATFAVTTAWQCHAVDPRLRVHGPWVDLPRLAAHCSGVEDMSFEADAVVVVMVHAHLDAATALRSVVAQRVLLIAMPCCVPTGLAQPPDVAFRDPHVGSPANEIAIWRDPLPRGERRG